MSHIRHGLVQPLEKRTKRVRYPQGLSAGRTPDYSQKSTELSLTNNLSGLTRAVLLELLGYVDRPAVGACATPNTVHDDKVIVDMDILSSID